MKVYNMTGRTGREVANQFIMYEKGNGANGNFIKREIFQSYSTVIAERIIWNDRVDITLDGEMWNYSKTTSKYLSQFLGGDGKKDIEKKIVDGTYKIAHLN